MGLGTVNYLSAQQLGLTTLYNQNNYFINPAAAGLNDCITAHLNHRNQWVGVDGSPTINTLVLDNRFGSSHGFGIDIRNLRSGLISNFNAKATYAYHLKVTDDSWLSAGISLGFIQQRFRFQDAIASDYTDDLLLQSTQSDAGFTSDIGLMYRWDKLTVGVAVPQVLALGLILETEAGNSEYRLVDHMNFYATYELINEAKWVVYPSVLYRSSDYLAHQIDIGANAMWNDIFGFGLMYRSTYGLAGMIQVNILEEYRFGYSYEFGGANITGVSTGTHEIMIGMRVFD